MNIIIREKSDFMPDTFIRIYEDRVEFEENNKNRVLKYNSEQIKEIMRMFLTLSKRWDSKYIGKGIIDDDVFVITVEGNKNKEFYIKNKYPQNWSDFVLFRNKLVREEIKFN